MDHFTQGERLDFERRVRDAMPERYDEPQRAPSSSDLSLWKQVRELGQRLDNAAERFAWMTDALHEANGRITQLEAALRATPVGCDDAED